MGKCKEKISPILLSLKENPTLKTFGTLPSHLMYVTHKYYTTETILMRSVISQSVNFLSTYAPCISFNGGRVFHSRSMP